MQNTGRRKDLTEHAKHWEMDEFDPSTFDICPLCGCPNARTHFPFNCEGVSDKLLANHNEVERMKRNFPHACFITVAYAHPHLELVKAIHERRELQYLLSLICRTLAGVGMVNHGKPTFFTDSSAIFPDLPGGNLAAFSILWDSSLNDQERIVVAQIFRCSKVSPVQLIPMQVALTCGDQTINRAELSAIIQIVRSCAGAFIYSDSAWAIDVFGAVRETPVYAAHMHRANFDLICDLIDLAKTQRSFSVYFA